MPFDVYAILRAGALLFSVAALSRVAMAQVQPHYPPPSLPQRVLPADPAPLHASRAVARGKAETLRIIDVEALSRFGWARKLPSPAAAEARMPVSIYQAPADELSPVLASRQQAEMLAVAEALLETRQPQRALEILAPLEASQSRDAEYNYLLGLAEVESGRPGEAIFSLQRTTAVRPDFAGAKMDLARAYFLSGDYVEARKTFTALRELDPPPELAQVIGRYLELIEQRELDARPHFGAGIELEAGYDSNANSGTRNESFGGFVLDAQSREQGSGYAGVGLLGSYRRPLSHGLRWSNALRVGYRHYPDAVFVASTGALASSDLHWRGQGVQLSAGLLAGHQWLDGEASQTIYGFNAGAGFPIGFSTRLGAQLRVGESQFSRLGDLRLRQLSGSLAWQWRPKDMALSAFDIGPTAGREEANRNSAPFTRTLYGVQSAADWTLLGYDWHGAVGYLLSDYDAVPFFGYREDQQLSLRVSLDGPILFGKWQLVPQLAVVDNHSNLALYEYRRFDFGVSAHRSMR